MTLLQRLESEILQHIDGLTLRPTLEKVCRIGRLLTEAKALVPYGEWTRWVWRVGLSLRSSHNSTCRRPPTPKTRKIFRQ